MKIKKKMEAGGATKMMKENMTKKMGAAAKRLLNQNHMLFPPCLL